MQDGGNTTLIYGMGNGKPVSWCEPSRSRESAHHNGSPQFPFSPVSKYQGIEVSRYHGNRIKQHRKRQPHNNNKRKNGAFPSRCVRIGVVRSLNPVPITPTHSTHPNHPRPITSTSISIHPLIPSPPPLTDRTPPADAPPLPTPTRTRPRQQMQQPRTPSTDLSRMPPSQSLP